MSASHTRMNHQSLSQRMANGFGSGPPVDGGWKVRGQMIDRDLCWVFPENCWFYQIITGRWLYVNGLWWFDIHPFAIFMCTVWNRCASAGYCAAMESLLGHWTQGSCGGCGECCTNRWGGTWKSTPKELKLSQTLNVYGAFTFSYPLNYPNVGKYTVHWVFASLLWTASKTCEKLGPFAKDRTSSLNFRVGFE